MGHEVTIGGERLGSGKRNKAYLHHYERSTHNLSYVWRSTMACGTLVPFLTEVALPGDTFDIDLNVDVLTHPTIGPLFGSYKIQLDLFQIPIRLYQGKLHMNMLGIGRDMSQILLPQVRIRGHAINNANLVDNQQISPSCIFSYLGIRGVGFAELGYTNEVRREFNAIPYLGYWDIYKNYYANKQEEIGAVIHKDPGIVTLVIVSASIVDGNPTPVTLELTATPTGYINCTMDDNTRLTISANTVADFNPESLTIWVTEFEAGGVPVNKGIRATELFTDWYNSPTTQTIIGYNVTTLGKRFRGYGGITQNPNATLEIEDLEPKISTFPLTNIDDMRTAILGYTIQPTRFLIDETTQAPYSLPLIRGVAAPNYISCQFGQEGLALKTYNSDLFNNWISTEWIDGTGGISEITAIDTSGGSFTIDELNMSRKVYDMLNRIAISGGSYDDWLDAVYTHERQRSAENPIYLGGLIRNLVFQEVVSNATTVEQPLGTLAGRGRLGEKHKGGSVIAKVDEPSYLMGIISLTPLVDYSQGNKWDVNLKTMNDFHKPALDEIGFQDLITDQMAWWDTQISTAEEQPMFKSAGKQPAWINYMTNVNQVRGNFADQSQQMFMTLNRRYEVAATATDMSIKDMTTYIDPVKFNHIFADTRRDAQNFWAQIGVNMIARRKMSAKIMPNL